MESSTSLEFLTDSALQLLREAELSEALKHFPPGGRVLEIGGGNGWQAKLLTEKGFSVESVDVALHAPEKTFFPVKRYDGVHLPFESQSFDVVFSSNVMEHVQQRELLSKEILRVCKPGAVVVHILPNPLWRLLTLLGFYPYKLQRILEELRKRGLSDNIAEKAIPNEASHKPFRHRILYDAAHGEFDSAIAELWYFSNFFWKRELAQNGLILLETKRVGYWYQGYSSYDLLSVATRSRIARCTGGVCTMYVLRVPQ